VDEVELDQVKPQPRFNTYGVPQNKTKKKKGDAKETVPNGNYLWINLFATSLKENGRAALVMANSASDAGHSEKDIRIKLIESGVISQMVTLPTNMFTSVTLPATLWFFNNAKPCKDEILFIDARNIFTQITRAHRKFSDEQIKNLAIISRLYEGKVEELAMLLNEYRAELFNAPETFDDEDIKPKAYWQEQIDWLTSRFPDGKYVDVIGLCKAAKLDGEDGIIDQDYSLNPGRYVGVVIEDDGMTEDEFKAEIRSLNAELSALNDEARESEVKIAENLRLLVGGE
jgi:type I restriction enzyme M protein